jgi:CheY-like chemotaxis protein
VFEVRLPRHHAVEDRDGGVDGRSLEASRPLRIVVVDDNADAAWTLATCLRAVGHEVEELTDPRSALAIPAARVPDVFLLDIGMPEIDGHELARLLRGQPHTASARLIAVTGYGTGEDGPSASDNFDRYLIKPVDLTKLVRVLDEVTRVQAKA